MNGLLAPGRVNLERTIAEYYRDNVYAVPSGILSNDMMDFCIKKIGIDHVLLSLDYPYVPLEGADKWLVENPSLSEEDKEKIAQVNAEKLFRL